MTYRDEIVLKLLKSEEEFSFTDLNLCFSNVTKQNFTVTFNGVQCCVRLPSVQMCDM